MRSHPRARAAGRGHGRAAGHSDDRVRYREHHHVRYREHDRAQDRGSLTLMLAVIMVALLALAGLVVDGGRKLNQSEGAYAIAQEAARAGAGMVDRSAAYSSGTFRVDQAQAIAAARAYLASAGYRGSVSGDGTERIRVTVTVTGQTLMLSLIGIDSMTSTGTAVASLVTGVTGPGS